MGLMAHNFDARKRESPGSNAGEVVVRDRYQSGLVDRPGHYKYQILSGWQMWCRARPGDRVRVLA